MKSKRSILVSLTMTCLIYSIGCKEPEYHINATMMESDQLRWDNDSTVLVIAGNSENKTKPLTLTAGKYSLSFKARGSKSRDVSPHMVIRLGDYVIKDIDIPSDLSSYTLHFELPERLKAPLAFIFDNDYQDSTGDRNLFLSFPITIKPY